MQQLGDAVSPPQMARDESRLAERYDVALCVARNLVVPLDVGAGDRLGIPRSADNDLDALEPFEGGELDDPRTGKTLLSSPPRVPRSTAVNVRGPKGRANDASGSSIGSGAVTSPHATSTVARRSGVIRGIRIMASFADGRALQRKRTSSQRGC